MSAVLIPERGDGSRRIVITNGWRIVQVRQRDGSWWNIRVERVR